MALRPGALRADRPARRRVPADRRPVQALDRRAGRRTGRTSTRTYALPQCVRGLAGAHAGRVLVAAPVDPGLAQPGIAARAARRDRAAPDRADYDRRGDRGGRRARLWAVAGPRQPGPGRGQTRRAPGLAAT